MMLPRCVLRPGSCVLMLRKVDSSTTSVTRQDFAAARSFEKVPGPKPLPLLGNAWRFVPGLGDLSGLTHMDLQNTLFKNYGRIVRIRALPFRNDLVYLFDPNDVEKVFRNDGARPVRDSVPAIYYYRTVTRKERFRDVGGGIVAQGEEWQTFRSKVNQAMMQHRSAKMYMNIINEVAGDFVKRVHELRDGTQELSSDFQNHLYKWALETIAAIALDTRLGCLDPNLAPDSEPQRMIHAGNEIFKGINLFLMKPYLWQYVSTKSWRRFVASLDLFSEVAWKHTECARMKTKEPGKELSILERLLEQESSSNVGAALAIDMLIGGIDTTANSMAVLLYHLAQHPEKQEALCEDLRREWPSDTEPLVTADKLNKLKYLRAFIKESMRVTPIITSNMRELVKDLVLSGYQVPKGTTVVTGQLLLSNTEDYVPQADKFLPERWIKDRNSESSKGQDSIHPFVYLPFGFGVRMCLGRRFAQLELEVLTAKIVRKYKVEYHHGEMEFKHPMFNSPTSPLRFRLVLRE